MLVLAYKNKIPLLCVCWLSLIANRIQTWPSLIDTSKPLCALIFDIHLKQIETNFSNRSFRWTPNSFRVLVQAFTLTFICLFTSISIGRESLAYFYRGKAHSFIFIASLISQVEIIHILGKSKLKQRLKYVKPGLHIKSDFTYGRLYSRMSFIYKNETSTLTPFIKPCII